MIKPSATFYDWAVKILTALGATPSAVGINALVAWMGFEHGWAWTGAGNNPMNTTYAGYGGTNVNQVGVKNYPTVADGLAATVATLTQKSPSYAVLVDALKSGNGSAFWSQAGRQQLSVWGGGASYADAVYQVYTDLQPVPSQYLAAHTSAGSGAASTTPAAVNAVQTSITDLMQLLGLNNFQWSGQNILPTAVVALVIIGLLAAAASG